MRIQFSGVLACALLGAPGQILAENEFFAMDTAIVNKLGAPLLPADVEMVAALGYRGVAPIANDPATWQFVSRQLIPMLDRSHLRLDAVYSIARVDRNGMSVDPGIRQNGAALKGRGTIIWLPISSQDFKPSDQAGDAMAVAAVREAADAAAEAGLSVSLYPHYGNLVERLEDAVRIAEKTGRPNVGVTFNLCHWLRTAGSQDLATVLRLAMPRLSLVTINGADRNGKDWSELIQPLDRGDFDIGGLLAELTQLGYRGPIGLQGYGVAAHLQIAPSESLRRSMVAWKRITSTPPRL